MSRYSIEPIDRMLVKSYGFSSFVKSIGEHISKNVSGKYNPGMLATCQKPLDRTKQSETDTLKTTSKQIIQKTAETTGNLIENKTANKITKI